MSPLPVLSLLIALPWGAAQAATPLAELRYSPDLTVTLGGTLLVDQEAGADDLVGSVAPLDIGPVPDTTDLAAYHLLPNGDRQLVFDTTVALGSASAEPRDVVRYNGAAYSLDLDGSAVGIPVGVRIDAIGRTLGGDLLLSFDTSVTLGGVTADDEDLVRFDGAFSLFLDASAAGVAPELDLDGAHILFNGHLLLTFDGSGTVSGFVFDDEDVLEYNPADASWELAYDGSVQHAGWAPAGLDALWAAEPASAMPGMLQFSAATYSVGEGGATAAISVTRGGGNGGAVSVDFTTSGGNATAGSDYTTTFGTLNWADGDTADKTFSVPILEDALVEGDESVNMSLSGPTGGAAVGAQGNATLIIVDNDTPAAGALQFSAATYSVGEGGATAAISVTRSGGNGGAVSVDFATSDGNATAGSDYTTTFGTLNWADGDTADKTFSVPILEDALVEGDESVNMSLSGPTGGGAVGAQGNATLIIVDNDTPAAGALQFSAATYSVGEDESSSVIAVTRSGSSVGAVSVSFATSDGSAVAGDDYITTAGTLSWADGDSAPKTFAVPILADFLDEGDETVNLGLNAPSGGAIFGTITAAVLTVTDDPSMNLPAPVPTLSQWAMLLLAGLMGLVGFWELRRRRVPVRLFNATGG